MAIFKNSQSGETGDTAYNAQDPGVGTAGSNPAPVRTASCAVSTAAAGSTAGQRWNLPGDGPWQFKTYKQIGAATNVDLDMIRLSYGASGAETNAFILRSQGTGLLRLMATGGATAYTSTASFPVGSWVRVEGYGSGTNNTARIRISPLETSLGGPGGSAVIDTGDGSANNVGGPVLSGMTLQQGSTGATFWREGKLSGATGYTALIAWDETELRTGTDAAMAFIGPYAGAANQPPTVSAGSQQVVAKNTQVTLNGTATDPDGTVASVAWTCPTYAGSSAPNITGSTAATGAKATLADPGTYVFRLTATDNQGATGYAEVTVYVYEASGVLAKVAAVNLGSWGTYGSPSSAVVGQNDGLATTGAESPATPSGQPLILTYNPVGPGTVTLPVYGHSFGGAISRKCDVYKADGTTKIYDDTAYTPPSGQENDAVHVITLDAAALALIPNVADRVALKVIVKDTAV